MVNILKKIKGFELYIYKLKGDNYYILGYFIEKHLQTKLGLEKKIFFREIFFINLKREKSIENKLKKYKKLARVTGVYLDKDFRGRGIGKFTYKFLINNEGFTILGNKEQYLHAKKLYARSSKELDIQIDIIDIKNYKIIEENVILHYDFYNEDFDKRLWSYNIDKENIKAVVKKILN